MMNCKHCQGKCIKKGFYKQTQLLFCTVCFKYQRTNYKKQRITEQQKSLLQALLIDGMSISFLSKLAVIQKLWLSIF